MFKHGHIEESDSECLSDIRGSTVNRSIDFSPMRTGDSGNSGNSGNSGIFFTYASCSKRDSQLTDYFGNRLFTASTET